MVLLEGRPALVDFYSGPCPPCRMLAPRLEEMAAEYAERALICKVNIDHSTALAEKYNITATPTVVFFHNGQEMERVAGLQSKAAYEKIIDHYIGREERKGENSS